MDLRRLTDLRGRDILARADAICASPAVMPGWCVLSVAASVFLYRRLMLVWERRTAGI